MLIVTNLLSYCSSSSFQSLRGISPNISANALLSVFSLLPNPLIVPFIISSSSSCLPQINGCVFALLTLPTVAYLKCAM